MCFLPRDRIAKREECFVCLSEFWLAVPLKDNSYFLLWFLTPKTWGSVCHSSSSSLLAEWQTASEQNEAILGFHLKNTGQYIIAVFYNLMEWNFFSCLYNSHEELAKILHDEEHDVERPLVRKRLPASSRKCPLMSLQCAAFLADAARLSPGETSASSASPNPRQGSWTIFGQLCLPQP